MSEEQLLQTKEKFQKPIYKIWWFWIFVVFILIVIISAGGGDKKETIPEVIPPIQEEITQPSQPEIKKKVEKEVSPKIEKDSFVSIREIPVSELTAPRYPQKTYYEEIHKGDGIRTIFKLKHSYTDITIRLNDDVQTIGDATDPTTEYGKICGFPTKIFPKTLYCDVAYDIKNASLKFFKAPSVGSIVRITGTPTDLTQKSQTKEEWKTVKTYQGRGSQDLGLLVIPQKKFRLVMTWKNIPTDWWDERWGIWECEITQEYESCALWFPAPRVDTTDLIWENPKFSIPNPSLKIKVENSVFWVIEVQESTL